VVRDTFQPRRHSPSRAVATSPKTDAKRRVGARVHAKANFTMYESDARRTFGSAWNTHLVSGTVESAHYDDSGKGARVSVAVMWDLPAGPKRRNVNVRSIAAGDVPRTARVDSIQQLRAAGGAADANVERDEGDRHRASSAYSVPRSPILPNTDMLAE
jgi:hypothetical protein